MDERRHAPPENMCARYLLQPERRHHMKHVGDRDENRNISLSLSALSFFDPLTNEWGSLLSHALVKKVTSSRQKRPQQQQNSQRLLSTAKALMRRRKGGHSPLPTRLSQIRKTNPNNLLSRRQCGLFGLSSHALMLSHGVDLSYGFTLHSKVSKKKKKENTTYRHHHDVGATSFCRGASIHDAEIIVV